METVLLLIGGYAVVVVVLLAVFGSGGDADVAMSIDYTHPLVVGALICAGLAVWWGIVRALARLCALNSRPRADEEARRNRGVS